MSLAGLQSRSDPAAATAARMGLSLGPKHDAHEHEADRVASHVAGGGSVAGMSLSTVDLGRHAPDPARRRSDPATNIPDRHAQRKLDPTLSATPHGAHVQQPAHVQRPGGGSALDPDTRQIMEARFHVNFERVRIHTGQAAAQKARSLHASAYTVGTDIFFAENRYAPNSSAGRELLAHELTHVVQQSPALVERPGGLHAAPAGIQRSVLGWIDDHLHPIEHLENAIRKIPGFKLAVLVLGKDPFDDTPAPRGAMAWVRAFAQFIPVIGDAVLNRLEESGALEAAYNWVGAQLDSLHLRLDNIIAVLNMAYDDFVARLPHIIDAVEGALVYLKALLSKAWEFIQRVGEKLLELAFEFAMKKLGGDEVVKVLKGGAETFFKIASHPATFLKNLIESVWKGFGQFSSKFGEHLKDGAMSWLFGSVSGDLKPRSPFNVAEILRLVLEITGLGWHQIRAKLVTEFGSEEAVAFLEKSWDFLIRIARARSMAAAWEMVLEEAKGLLDGVIHSITEFVTNKIVAAGVEALVKLFSPVGALVQAIEMIYHFIKFIIDKKDQLVAFVRSVTASINAIVSGNISAAADAVEGALAKGIAPALGLLAEQVHLGDIGQQIHKIVTSVRNKIGSAVDRVIAKVADIGRRFYAKGKETVGKVYEWFNMRKELLIGEEEHSLYMEGPEDAPELMIASTPGVKWATALKYHSADKSKESLLAETRKLARKLEEPFNTKNPKEKTKKMEEKRQLFNKIADNLVAMRYSDKKGDAVSVVHFDPPNSKHGGATKMTASVLTKAHIHGTRVADRAPIWNDIDQDLRQERHYIQGHLLSEKLGGPGRRFNLSPLTNAANQKHEQEVESDLKQNIDGKGETWFYEVEALYEGSHGPEPDDLVKLREDKEMLESKGKKLSAKRESRLKSLIAERRAPRAFRYENYPLKFVGGDWTKAGPGKSGSIKNDIYNG